MGPNPPSHRGHFKLTLPKSKVDRVWDAFWSGGISNPLEVIEQITYLLFIRRLDDLNTLAEKKAHRTGKSEGIIFGPDQQDLRWSVFKNDEPARLYESPYTGLAATGPEAIFTEGQVDNIVDILNIVKANALPTGGAA